MESLWPQKTHEWNMNPDVDLITDDNYKNWVVLQTAELLKFTRYKRVQVLYNESGMKK